MALVRRATFFFFNDTATTEIYTLSLHDALPIYDGGILGAVALPDQLGGLEAIHVRHLDIEQNERKVGLDRKSTRLNSSHSQISYAVFCLKKKKKASMRSEHSNLNFAQHGNRGFA